MYITSIDDNYLLFILTFYSPDSPYFVVLDLCITTSSLTRTTIYSYLQITRKYLIEHIR